MHQHTSGFLTQRFRRMGTPLKPWLLGIIGFRVICWLFFPVNMLAGPTAEWTTPWNVTLENKSEFGNASDTRAFGDTSTTDGQINNIGSSGETLPGTPAVAKSMSSVSSAVFFASLASTSVIFNRTFSLDGSPHGWLLSIEGEVTGKLSAINASLNPRASLMANAAITGQGGSNVGGISIPLTVVAPVSETISRSDFNSFAGDLFPDGIYNVSGSLVTSASVDNSLLLSGGAVADFFDSFTVSVGANPVSASPVPETINLIGGFAVVGFCGYIWFRRSRALRCS